MSGVHPDGERIDELIALAVFGEISAAEEAELDAALAADAGLAADLDADLEVAARLQHVHAEAPPVELKARVMEAIDQLDASARPTPQASPPTNDDVVDLAAARSRRSRRWQPLASAAAVMMLVVGGVLFVARSGDESSPFDPITQAEDVQQRTLNGDLDGVLEVAYSPSHSAFVLVGHDIPALSEAETYQLWLVDDTGAQSVGLFQPDDNGHVEQRFDNLNLTGFVVGVTIEPAAGSQTPTSPVVASA